jgi:MraZ protein
MSTFIGEYHSKLDAKNRTLLPSGFKKQLDSADKLRFVVKKNVFENCLELYPISEWEKMNKFIRSRTNSFNKKHNEFLRAFYRGAAEIELDSSGRMLLPSRLLDKVGIEKDVVFAGQDGKIELWSKDVYDQNEMSEDVFSDWAEDILGGSPFKEEEE